MSNMENYNKQQQKFIIGKVFLKKYKKIEEQRPLTAKERYKKDKIMEGLFATVLKYGMSLANQRLPKYKTDSDAYPEIQQSLATIFFDKLEAYDPLKTKPTTYFAPYFNQEISRYINANSQHLTPYDAKNVSAVRRAKQYYESRGINWDLQMLVNRTGLSPKVVKNTLTIESNSQRALIDEETYELRANSPTPEDEYIKNEEMNVLQNALKQTLDYTEMEFFMYKVNLDSCKERTYNEVAEHYNMPVRDVKKKYSSIVTRLNNNKALQAYHNKNKKEMEREANVFLRDSAGTIMEHQIMGYIVDNAINDKMVTLE